MGIEHKNTGGGKMKLERIPKLLKGWDQEYGGITSIRQQWCIDGHEVAIVSTEGHKNNPDFKSGYYMTCECSFDDSSDEERCPVRERVRKETTQQMQEKYCDVWCEMGTKDSVQDIFNRVQAGEYLGQRYPSIIFIQEVAKLLDVEPARVWEACDELFAEERLDLNGAILTEYISRFRFPKEIQSILRYIVEEPLGWPNGDAGEGFLYTIENAIHENTGYKHGRDAFEEEYYPNLPPHILLMFGLAWVRNALTLMNLSEQDMIWLRAIADGLEENANKIRDYCSKKDNTDD